MHCNELFEARKTLPLNKDVMAIARDRRTSLLVVMSPLDFLRLTTADQAGIDQIFSNEFASLDAYNRKLSPDEESQDPLYHKSMYYMPYLNVRWPSGIVTGHEGRHRAAMVAKAGGTNFPVAVRFSSEMHYVLRYEQVNHETEESEDKYETFVDLETAKQRSKELKALNKAYDQPDSYAYYDVKLDTVGGDVMRKHSEQRAWKPSDLPAQLIGQFNPSIVIPTSRMRAGVVKS